MRKLATALALVLACGSDPINTTGGNGGMAGQGGTGASAGGTGGTGGATGGTGGVVTGGAGGGTGAGIPPPPTQIVPCQNQVYECGDLIDNDNDGLLDYQDPDCLGACDNSESGFDPMIPGGSGPACTVDCYFDGDSGAGNDDCYWSHQCDPLNPEDENSCPYDPNANTPGTGLSCAELSMAQSQTCYDICKPLVPNGCDCFGCCELPAGSGKHVWLASQNDLGESTCNLANVNDPLLCKPCTQVPGCNNPCDPCELCIGKTELPPECSGGGGAGGGGGQGGGGGAIPQCPDGVQPCGLEGLEPCPQNFYCTTGCCQAIPN